MKKYLMISAAALSFCGLFTSCTHDLDDSGYSSAAEKSVINTYKEAFVTAFGQPAPTQTWGFGASTAMASTRASEGDYTGSYAKTLDDFLNPTTARDSYGNTWSTNLKRISIDDMKAYTTITDDDIKIHNTLSNGYNFPKGDFHHYRVAPNTEIKEVFHFNAEYGVVNDAVLYIEGKVHLNGNTLNGTTLVIASGGELIIDGNTGMSNAGRFVVMPGGKITGANGVAFNVNNGGQCYNAGTIEYNGELNVNGSDTYNNGTIKVDVLRNTAGGFFTNFGKITARTNIGAGDSYNSQIINACYMHFTENAGIGTLTLLDNSRLDVDGTAEFNQANQYLYKYSMINAGAILVNATKFFGPENTSDYALIKTDRIIWAGNILINQDNNNWVNTQWQDSYDWVYVAQPLSTPRGTVYVDWDNTQLYDAQGNSKNGDMQWRCIALSNFNYITESTAGDVFIPEGECTGSGYNVPDGPTPPTPPTPPSGTDESDPGVVRIICEDLSAKNEANGNSDWDFNDVVFDVRLIDNNARVEIKLLAAGGTLPLTVADHEVHEEFAEANPTANISTGTMINTKNTGAKYTLRGLTPGYIYADIQPKWRAEEGELGLLKSVAKNIPVQVYKLVGNEKKWVTMECIQGEPAAKIAVGNDYNWCDERTDIRNNFKASAPNGAEVSTFKMFVKDKLSATEWYKTKEVTISDVQEFLISE